MTPLRPAAGVSGLLDAPVGPVPADASPGLRALATRAGQHPVVFAALTAVTLEALYLLVRPQAPDLVAQLARAAASSRGADLWWAGWYGGVNIPTYSLLSGAIMARAGVLTFGVLATALVCVLGADLLRGTARPRLGAVAVSIAACANLASGRLTFAAGMVPALAALVLLRRGRPRAAAAAGALSGLLSPLATVVTLVALASMFLSGHPRRPLVLVGVACALPVGALSLLFSQPSTMPFPPMALVGILVACLAVALLPVPPSVRVVAGVTGVLALVAWAVPSPLGVNVARLPMLLAAPIVLATVRVDSPLVRFAVAGLVAWPVSNLGMELAIGAGPSTGAAYYAPLLRELPRTGSAVQRLELVDTRTHGGALHLSGRVPLARGWERQADVAKNPLFYDDTLTAASYRSWLQARAVGWVALSSAEPDYGAADEAALIGTGRLPYLRQVWSNPDWRLFRVTLPAPAATGGLTVTALQETAVQLHTDGPADGVVRLAFSQLLGVHLAGDPMVRGCTRPGPDGDLEVSVPSAGDWTIEPDVTQLFSSCREDGPGASRRAAGGARR